VRPRALRASTPRSKDGSKRSLQTISPLADIGLEVDTDFGRSDVKALAKRVLRTPGPVLISWQREYLPEIVDALGEVDSTPPDPWPEDRFDVIWLLTRSGRAAGRSASCRNACCRNACCRATATGI
jgi:hypothetical protein